MIKRKILIVGIIAIIFMAMMTGCIEKEEEEEKVISLALLKGEKTSISETDYSLLFGAAGEYFDGRYREATIAIYRKNTFLTQQSIGRSHSIKVGGLKITLKDIDVNVGEPEVLYATVNVKQQVKI